jgi:hypothetical protein
MPVLVLYAPNDLIFNELTVQETIKKIAGAGALIESATLVGPNGHLNALTQIEQGADRSKAFLDR